MSDGDSIDPEDLEVCLRVIAEIDELPIDHPDAIAIQRATSASTRPSQRRRAERREAIASADRAVTEATATAAPGRIDDETRGLPLQPRAAGRTRGHAASGPGLLHLQAAVHVRSTPSTTSSVRTARR